VNDVLDYSKIEAGGITLEQAPFALHRAAEDTLSLVAGEAARKGLDLVYVEEGDLPDAVVGDLARLRQVLLNLLTNAIKFTDNGSVTLTAAMEEPDRIRYTVRDTGSGIPADRLPHLFKRFAQADVATTRTHGGTGLGLVISKGLVELMGGDIDVRSEPGPGSTFSFAIDAPAVELPENERWDVPPGALAGRSVVVIGADTADAHLLVRLLKRWEMQVLPAEGPPADVALVNRRDAVLLSERMNASDTEQFDAVVRKPLRRQALWRALLEVLEGERAAEGKPGLDPTLAHEHPLEVLIAEDSSANQLALRSMLERLGYKPDVVGDGVEAIHAALHKSYDVVLMDNQMPNVDGIAATREICARLSPERRPAIISVSAGTDKRHQAAVAEAGMVGRISKPVTPERLVEALRRVRPLGAHARPDARDRKPVEHAPDAEPAAARDHGEDAIDVEALEDRVGALSDDQLERVVKDFREQGHATLLEMTSAAERANLSAFTRAAHRLLGSALLLEAGPLSRHLRHAEGLTDHAKPELADLVERARELFASADAALAGYLRSR
jgi:CheY-like chemotaxis protein